MSLISQIKFLLHISGTNSIVRRYFVVNGFDGALTMLGLITGFLISEPTDLRVIISACLGTAIALGVSGISSAYVSEQAERRRALGKLEDAMVSDLQQGAHGEAARWIPLLIALVNGAAPLFICMIIILPLWLSHAGIELLVPPLYASVGVAFILIFLLGVFLGRVAEISWFRSGLQTVLIALLTIALISSIAGS